MLAPLFDVDGSKREGRLADVVRSHAIGAGDLQHIESEVAGSKIDRGLRARPLAGIAEVPIERPGWG